MANQEQTKEEKIDDLKKESKLDKKMVELDLGMGDIHKLNVDRYIMAVNVRFKPKTFFWIPYGNDKGIYEVAINVFVVGKSESLYTLAQKNCMVLGEHYNLFLEQLKTIINKKGDAQQYIAQGNNEILKEIAIIKVNDFGISKVFLDVVFPDLELLK